MAQPPYLGDDVPLTDFAQRPYGMLLAQGLICASKIVQLTGRNPDIDSGSVPEDIFENGGLYPGFNATGAEVLDVVSTDANDTAAGSGAQAIVITGLDGDYNEITEILPLNGLTPVKSANAYLRVNTPVAVVQGATNDGDITLTQETSLIEMDRIVAGIGQARKCAYTVPVDKDYYATLAVGANVATVSGAITVLATNIRHFGSAFIQGMPFDLASGGNPAVIPLDVAPIKLPSKADFSMRAISADSNNSAVSFTVFGELIDREPEE